MVDYKTAVEALKYCNSHPELTDEYRVCEKCPVKDVIDCVHDCEMAILEHIDEFKWHDLRKDPTDLPKTEGTIDICLNGIYIATEYIKAISEAYFIPGSGFTGNKELDDIVIAWKWCEPFDEV